MDEVELAVALGAAAAIPVPVATNSDDLRFHHVHGHNATILSGGKTAARPNARGEFNDAIVTSNRPLRDNELFEVSIDKMVDRWSGSIEAGSNHQDLIYIYRPRMKYEGRYCFHRCLSVHISGAGVPIQPMWGTPS